VHHSLDIVKGASLSYSNWVIEEKFDGVRAMIVDGVLYNRYGKNITHLFPEFYGLDKIKGTWDGEVVASSGKLCDVSGRLHLRDKLKINLLSRVSPARFVCWDCVHDGVCDISTRSLDFRRGVLDASDFIILFTWFEVVPQRPFSSFSLVWEEVIAKHKEGVIFKALQSSYEFGVRSKNWLKLKAFVEVEVDFVKYDVHSKGITIETQDGRRVVINGVEAVVVKKLIDSVGVVRCAVQFLPQVNSDAWRFPSFRGVVK
jgi:ATP-dependent DNA ligase